MVYIQIIGTQKDGASKMTTQQITDRTEYYRAAMFEGRITSNEFYGFLEALARLAVK